MIERVWAFFIGTFNRYLLLARKVTFVNISKKIKFNNFNKFYEHFNFDCYENVNIDYYIKGG